MAGATARVVFYRPTEDASDAWTGSALVRTVDEDDRLRVVFDTGGVEAARFGAVTSGSCVLYDADGRLLFSGGVTAGRGHAGPSQSQTLLLTCLNGEVDSPTDCPVYGCLLRPREVE